MKTFVVILVAAMILGDGFEHAFTLVAYSVLAWLAVGCCTLIYGAMLSEGSGKS